MMMLACLTGNSKKKKCLGETLDIVQSISAKNTTSTHPTNLRAIEWAHSVVISRGEVIVNETSPTSARYKGPILHASLHVYSMDHYSIE